MRQEHVGGENCLGKGELSGKWARQTATWERHVLGRENGGRVAMGASNYRPHSGEVLLRQAVWINGTSVGGGKTKLEGQGRPVNKNRKTQSITSGK